MYCVNEVLLSSFCLRIVCGEPTVTVRPKTEQNFRRNEQACGEAYVPRLKSTARDRVCNRSASSRSRNPSGVRKRNGYDRRFRKLEQMSKVICAVKINK